MIYFLYSKLRLRQLGYFAPYSLSYKLQIKLLSKHFSFTTVENLENDPTLTNQTLEPFRIARQNLDDEDLVKSEECSKEIILRKIFLIC